LILLWWQDNALSKAEILSFIKVSIERGRFARLFEARDGQMMAMVELFFERYF